MCMGVLYKFVYLIADGRINGAWYLEGQGT